MNNSTARVLITGGNGNLGCLLAERLLDLGQHVVKFDVAGINTDRARENEVIITGDMRDTDLLHKIVCEHQPDVIYHLASLLSGSSETNLRDAWEINATSSFELMQLAQESGVGKFFFASTVATYRDVDKALMPEDSPQWPQNMYGVTKVAVEKLGVYFKTSHGLDFRCLRFPLVISPYAPASALSAFPSHAFKAAYAGEKYIFPVAQNTGVSTIFIDDVVDSIVNYTATSRARLTRHTYNLHAYYLSAGMVADAIRQRVTDFDYGFEPVTTVDQLISSWPDVIDDRAARADWGWDPAFDFARSADRMVELLSHTEIAEST